jgi:predicted RNase H-like HicB family nuclease
MTRGETHIVVYIPDFDINTQGKDYADAMEMARDAIGIVGIDMEDDNEALPKPSELSQTLKRHESDIVTLVDVDFAEYRRKNDMRAVKKNCTIPSWLNFEAEKAGVNFSAVLQSALKETLNLDM